MTWAVPVALGAVAALLLLPARDRRRIGLLRQRGRLATSDAETADLEKTRPPGPLLSSRLLLAAGLALCCALGALTTTAVGFEAAVVSAVVGLLARDAHRLRDDAARSAEFRAAIGLLIGELEAGSSAPAALDAAATMSGRLAATLAPAARAAQRGHDAGELLCASGDRDLRRLGVVWRVGESSGVPLREVLERLVADLDSAVDQQRAVSVVLAGPRSSAALLCLLPLLGVALGAAMGARPLPLLFGTQSGQLLCCLGLTLDALGVMWVRRIVMRAGRE